MFNFEYPNTNFHELNLDFLISQIIKINEELKNVKQDALIKYADPIQWDITRQYEENTVVVNPLTGTAYISSKPVRNGIAITNTEYWNEIYNFNNTLKSYYNAFTHNNDGESVYATKNYNKGDLVWSAGRMLECLENITQGSLYVPDANCKIVDVDILKKERDLKLNDFEAELQDINTRVNNITELDECDIRKYGGVADGVTDNTAAFNACMDENGTVYIPASDNEYLLSDVTILQGQTVYGEAGTKIKYNGDGVLFTITGSFVNIKNLTINCNNAGTIFSIINANESRVLQYVKIYNVLVFDANMILYDGGSVGPITNLYVEELHGRRHNGRGVYLQHGIAFIFLHNVTIDYVGKVGNAHVFDFRNNSGMHLVHCEAEGGASDGSHAVHTGFYFKDCHAVWLERCMSDTLDGSGITIEGNSSYFYFNNCVISLCKGNGIILSGTKMQFNGCAFYGAKGTAVTVAGANAFYLFGTDIIINNCIVENFTGYPFAINGTVQYANIANCNIWNNDSNVLFVGVGATGIMHDCVVVDNCTVSSITNTFKVYNLLNNNELKGNI